MDKLYELDIFNNYTVSTLRKVLNKLDSIDDNLSRDNIRSLFIEEELYFMQTGSIRGLKLADKFVTGIMCDYNLNDHSDNKVSEFYRTRVLFVDDIDLDYHAIVKYTTTRGNNIYYTTSIITHVRKATNNYKWVFRVLSDIIEECYNFMVDHYFGDMFKYNAISKYRKSYLKIRILDDVADLKYSDFDAVCYANYLPSVSNFKQLYDFIISTDKHDHEAFNNKLRELVFESNNTTEPINVQPTVTQPITKNTEG